MKIPLKIFIAILLGFSLLTENIEAKPENKYSRFSIAISGGASKGAYEAGLNWGVLKIILESPKLKTMTGGQFIPLEAGSITGASAGGINTLLSGLTLCSRPEAEGGLSNHINDNVFRDIWLRADINTLLPRKADSPIYLPDDAVLSRKDFLDAAAELRDKWNTPSFRQGCRIPLGVTVTRIDPDKLTVGNVEVQNQRFYIPFELRVTTDNSIKFFFNPADYPKLADPAMILMPRSLNAQPFSIDDQRVEDAAFTTSAFPMAFGRKRLQYCSLTSQETTGETGQQNLASTRADTDLVCPDGYELTEAEFADGGLFDNLPIGVARTLAELNKHADDYPSPVTYFYIDPNRIRYEIPTPKIDLACDSDNPPEACRIMEFSAASESQLLVGFLGTARRYELYRELTSDDWQLNLSEISYRLAEIIKHRNISLNCHEELPYFDRHLDCAEALSRAGKILEIAYDRKRPVIDEPYSVDRLLKKGVISHCKHFSDNVDSQNSVSCTFDIPRYREQLADAMQSIVKQAKLDKKKIYRDIYQSSLSMQNDRILRVSSRAAPITGTLLEDFGSFLDYKFREYDYYVGVYDSVILIANNLCNLQYSSAYQTKEFSQCFDSIVKQLYTTTGLKTDPRGKYVFARLARREFAEDELLRFAFEPMPAADHDMHIIHEGLNKALAVGENEKVFFKHLKAEGFVPTQGKADTKSGHFRFIKFDEKPLLQKIIDDPDSWDSELTRRVTTRLAYLETEAGKIYTAREPDKQKRKRANTELMGAAAFVMQSATYRYPEITFAPSTAPKSWFWRNIIPFELGFDLAEGDLLIAWQPTLSLSNRDLAGIRASLGFPGGLFQSSSDAARENFLGVGIDYTRLTSSILVSSYGITPTWYHTFDKPQLGDQDTFGGDIHVGILKNRLRLGVGVRDIDNAEDTWFLMFSITDIPGMLYWLTR